MASSARPERIVEPAVGPARDPDRPAGQRGLADQALAGAERDLVRPGRRSRTTAVSRSRIAGLGAVRPGRTRRAARRPAASPPIMIMRQTSPRSRWPCSRPPMRARLESSQPCSAFFFVVSRRVTIIWLMLSLSSATSPCASTAIRWVRSPRVTAVDTCGDRAQLGGQRGGELVDVLGQVPPGAGDALAPGPGRRACPRCRPRGPPG